VGTGSEPDDVFLEVVGVLLLAVANALPDCDEYEEDDEDGEADGEGDCLSGFGVRGGNGDGRGG
jgi:hypothetical protein